MYHGAALIQVAEQPEFTAINSLKIAGEVISNAYKINDTIAIYLKYASSPSKPFGEYQFTFTLQHLVELADISRNNEQTFIALVCVKIREICCMTYDDLKSLVQARKNAKGSKENQYVVLVTAPKGKGFRVYVNEPGKKKLKLGADKIIARNEFPRLIFK